MDLTNRLTFLIETLGLDKAEQISGLQKNIATATKLTNDQLKQFDALLKSAASGGNGLRTGLEQIAKSNKTVEDSFRNAAKAILENDKAQRAATASAERESKRRIQIAQQEAAEAQRSANAAFQTNMRIWRQQEAERRRLDEERKRTEAKSERGTVQNLRGFNVLAGINNSRTLDPMIARVAGGAAAPILGGLAVAGIAEGVVRSATTDARNLQNLANEMGITASQAFKLSAAANLSGQSMESLSGIARKLEEALDAPGGAGKKTAEELTKLGVSLNQNLGSALEQTLQKLANMPDAWSRNAEAARLFGENGPKIAEIASNLKDVGQSLDENVQKKLIDANRALADFGNTWTIVKGQIAAAVTSTVSSFWNAYQNTYVGLEGIAASDYDKVAGGLLGTDNASARARTRPGAPAGVDLFTRSGRLSSAIGSGKLGLDDQTAAAKAEYENASARGRNMIGSEPFAKQEQQASAIEAARRKYDSLEAQRRGPRTESEFGRMMTRLDVEQYRNTRRGEGLGRIPELQGQMVEQAIDIWRNPNYTASQKRTLLNRMGQTGTQSILAERGTLADAELQRQMKSGAVSDEFNRDVLGVWNKPVLRGQFDYLRSSLQSGREGFAADRAIAGIQRTSGVDALSRQLGFQQRLSTISGGGQETASTIGRGMNSELAIAQMTAQTRRQAIEDSKDLYNDQQKRIELARIESDLTKQMDEARLSAAEKLIELQQRQHQETGNFTSGLVNAAMDGNVGGFFRSFGRQQLSTIAGNFGKNLPFTLNSAGSLGGTGLLGSADKPSFMGKLLQGTPFGLDPGKSSNPGLDTNTLATAANTGATQSLTSVLAAISGVSPAAVAASGGGVSSGMPAALSSISGLTGTPPFLPNRIVSNADIGIPAAHSGIVLPNLGGGSASGGYAGAGSALQQIMGGAGGVFNGQALNSILYGGTVDKNGAWTSSTGMERLGSALGLGASTAGGVLGALSGFKSGGARGITQGIGSSLAAAAPFAGPAAPFLSAGAAITGLISSLFPDPRKQRMEQEQRTVTRSAFVQPASKEYSFGSGGGSGFSYTDGGGIVATNQRTVAPNITIQAMDAQSFVQWGQDNSAAFAQAMLYGVTNGGSSALTAQLALQNPNSGWG